MFVAGMVINLRTRLVNLLHPKICSLHIFRGADKENLFKNQELLQLVIISFILVTLMFDSGVIWYGRNYMLMIHTMAVRSSMGLEGKGL